MGPGQITARARVHASLRQFQTLSCAAIPGAATDRRQFLDVEAARDGPLEIVSTVADAFFADARDRLVPEIHDINCLLKVNQLLAAAGVLDEVLGEF
jgi:hypothetical protein